MTERSIDCLERQVQFVVDRALVTITRLSTCDKGAPIQLLCGPQLLMYFCMHGMRMRLPRTMLQLQCMH